MRITLTSAWLGLVLSGSLNVAVRGNVYAVASVSDLVAAINAANGAAGPHAIQINPGLYLLTAELPTIAKNKTIVFQGGTGNPNDTVLRQTAAKRILESAFDGTANNVVLTFNNLTFADGRGGNYGGGAILVGGVGSSTTFNNCVFSNNTTGTSGVGLAGGAIENSPDGFLTVTGCRFVGNSAALYGGAISFLHQADSASAGGLTVNDSSFLGNSSASHGGAISADAASGTISIQRCNFETNRTTVADAPGVVGGRGGAIAHGLGSLVGQYNRFVGNSAATHANGDTLYQSSGGGSFDASRNWWGANTGPGATDLRADGAIATAPWLQLRLTAPASLAPGGGGAVVADLYQLSTGGTAAAGSFAGLPGLPSVPATLFANLTPALGSLSGTATQFGGGAASAQFTAGAAKGVAAVKVTLDAQSLSASIALPVAVASIQRTGPSPANLSTVGWQVNFDAPVSGVTAANFSLVNVGLSSPSILTVVPSGGAPSATWTVSASTGSGSGTLGLNLTGGSGISLPLSNLPFVGDVYFIDLVAPTTTLIVAPPSASSSGLATFAFTGSDTGSGVLGFDFSLDGSPFAATTSPRAFSGLADGPHSFSVRAKDNAGNVDATPEVYSWTIDATPPAPIIGPPSLPLTRSGPVTFTVSYVDAHFLSSSLSSGNLTLNKTGTANATVGVSGSGNTRTVTLSSITGDGTLGISLAAGTAVDTLGNTAPAVGPSGTFVVDNTGPGVTISAPSVAATVAGPVSYLVTFSDPHFNVSTLTAGGITLNKTGTANGSVGLSGSGNTRTVTLSGITGNGTLGISVAAGVASDLAGNLSPATGPSGTFAVDSAGLAVVISPPSVASTSSGPVSYLVTYTSAIFDASTLSPADITLNATETAAASVGVSGSGNTRTVTLSGITGKGTLGISLGANTATDLAGRHAPAAGPSATFVVNHLPTAANLTLERGVGQTAKVKVADLLAGAADADGDPLTLTSVQSPSPAGALVQVKSGWVLYTPPPGLATADSFTFTVSDTRGGSGVGTVTVRIADSNEAAQNVLSIQNLGGGHIRIRFAGVPGRVYTIQKAPSAAGPWTNAGSAGADSLGVAVFDDAAGSTATFYRTVYP